MLGKAARPYPIDDIKDPGPLLGRLTEVAVQVFIPG
jgi:hypothetical protein